MDVSESDVDMIEAQRDLEMEKRALAASLKRRGSDDKIDEKNILLNAQAQFVQQTRLLQMEIESAILDLTKVVEEEKKKKQNGSAAMYLPSTSAQSPYNPAVNPGGTVL